MVRWPPRRRLPRRPHAASPHHRRRDCCRALRRPFYQMSSAQEQQGCTQGQGGGGALGAGQRAAVHSLAEQGPNHPLPAQPLQNPHPPSRAACCPAEGQVLHKWSRAEIRLGLYPTPWVGWVGWRTALSRGHKPCREKNAMTLRFGRCRLTCSSAQHADQCTRGAQLAFTAHTAEHTHAGRALVPRHSRPHTRPFSVPITAIRTKHA